MFYKPVEVLVLLLVFKFICNLELWIKKCFIWIGWAILWQPSCYIHWWKNICVDLSLIFLKFYHGVSRCRVLFIYPALESWASWICGWVSFVSSRKFQLLFLQIFFFCHSLSLLLRCYAFFIVPSRCFTFSSIFFITSPFSSSDCLVSSNPSSNLLILSLIMSNQILNPLESFFNSYYVLVFFIWLFFNVLCHFL